MKLIFCMILAPQLSGGWWHNYSTKTRQAGSANEQSMCCLMSWLALWRFITNLNTLSYLLFLAIYGSKNLASDSAAKMFKITLPFSLSFRQRSSPCLRLRPPERVVVCVGGGGRSVAHPVRSPQQQQPRRRTAAARAAAQRRRLQLHAGRPRKFKRSLRQFSILIHLFIYGQYVKLSRANSSATVLGRKD